jgi:hypothetical protein
MDKAIKDMTLNDLLSPSKNGNSRLFMIALEQKLHEIPYPMIMQIPMDRTGWLWRNEKKDSTFWTLSVIIEIALQGQFIVLPEEIVNAIPVNEDGWLLTKISRYGAGLLHALAQKGDLRLIPPHIVRQIPMDQNGFLSMDTSMGKTPIDYAVIDTTLLRILNEECFPPDSINTLTRLEQLKAACHDYQTEIAKGYQSAPPTAADFKTYFSKIEHLQQRAKLYLLQNKLGKKKFTLEP